MTLERPSPDTLLARVQAEEARAARGKLKIFFGAAPGVGKTYAMLEAGRKIAKEGTDVLVGYIEPHVRPETQALVLGLDMLARREITYRGAKLLEFDLEAALVRRPQVILVDELAHTNAPGSTHAKRWQDVDRLLQAGIDVYTTLNVQHLESLNDVIAQITGVIVRETVPDSVFEKSDEVELVDIAPDDLIGRLREGKVYVPDQARRAIDNYFQKGNLIALRELALRRMAERVDAQMAEYRSEHAITRTWPAAERLLVCVGPSPMSARLVRTTRRMAASLRAPWIAANVETPAAQRMNADDRYRLAETLHLAEQLGAETVTLTGQNMAEEVVAYARGRNVTKIIVGKPRRTRWSDRLRSAYVDQLIRLCGDIDVYVTSGEEGAIRKLESQPRGSHPSRLPYLWAMLVMLLCTAVGAAMSPYFVETNIVMVYLIGIVVVALRFGRGPSILASVVGVAAFDFFFVPPVLTFVVHDTQYLVTFLVMLATGLVISELTARVQFQAAAARQRERRTAALYAMSSELAAMQNLDAIVAAAIRHTSAVAGARVAIFLPNEAGHLIGHPEQIGEIALPQRERGVVQWVFDHAQTAGLGTNTLPAAEALCLPLVAAHGTVGVLSVQPTDEHRFNDPEQVHLLETFAGLTALAVERAQLAAQTATSRVQIETERLRNSLLSAVSHDLRTPLAAIAGASSTLLDAEALLGADARRELAESIYQEADRLNRLVANLLDMTRLEGGAISLRRQWQPLEEVVGAVLARLARQLQHHTVETRLPLDLPLLPIDEMLVQQVLVNLLENAGKFSPPGAAIELSAWAEDSAVTIEVADRGTGLPDREQERVRVFEKFYRGPGQESRSGAGLGLAICRGIVELHGGRIWAENRPGGGAAFRFTLPAAGSPVVGAPPAVVPSESSA